MSRNDPSVGKKVDKSQFSGRLLGRLFARLSPLQRSLISALAGFFFYGAWAFWANHEHGPVLALKAGFVQGSYSFALTLCMTMLLEAIFRINTRVFNQRHVVNWLTIIICCALIFSSSWLINVIAETPEIFRTVILGYVVGLIYSTLYVLGLSKTLE